MQVTYDSSRIRGLKPADRILVEGSDDGGRTFYWHPKEMTVAKWRRGFRFKHDAGYLWLDFVSVGTTQPKESYPVGGEKSAVQRIDPILFV